MKMNITIPTWTIPTVITIAAIAYAFSKEMNTGGYLQGIETIFYLAGAFALSTVAWIVYAIFK